MTRLSTKVGCEPRIIPIMCAIANVAGQMMMPAEVVITAGVNGQHMVGSKHGSYEALDVRSKNFSSLQSKQTFAAKLRKELGPGYDVILEAIGQPHEHFHIEYDPS